MLNEFIKYILLAAVSASAGVITYKIVTTTFKSRKFENLYAPENIVIMEIDGTYVYKQRILLNL